MNVSEDFYFNCIEHQKNKLDTCRENRAIVHLIGYDLENLSDEVIFMFEAMGTKEGRFVELLQVQDAVLTRLRERESCAESRRWQREIRLLDSSDHLQRF